MGSVSEPLLPGRFVQLRAEGQLQNLLGRELHPVRFERVSPRPGDERRFIVGVDLEPAVAVEYSLHRGRG